MALNDLNEYWITIRFATGSVQEFRATGLLNALNRASEIILACSGIMVIECNVKAIQ